MTQPLYVKILIPLAALAIFSPFIIGILFYYIYVNPQSVTTPSLALSSDLEVKVNSLLNVFSTDNTDKFVLDFSILAKRQISRICIQYPDEAKNMFEQRIGQSVDVYSVMPSYGMAWWLFFSDGTSETIKINYQKLLLSYNRDHYQLKKCALTDKITLFHSDSNEMSSTYHPITYSLGGENGLD